MDSSGSLRRDAYAGYRCAARSHQTGPPDRRLRRALAQYPLGRGVVRAAGRFAPALGAGAPELRQLHTPPADPVLHLERGGAVVESDHGLLGYLLVRPSRASVVGWLDYS